MHKYFLTKAAELMQIQIMMLDNFLSVIKLEKDKNAMKLLEDAIFGDMHDLKKQIQVACDHVIYGVSRVQGLQVNTKLDLSRGIILGLEGKVEEAKKMLSNFIQNGNYAELDSEIHFRKESREYRFKNAVTYFEDWVIPNTYFHATIAYAILRKNGINIGKANFLSAKITKNSKYGNLEELPFGGKIYNVIEGTSCQNSKSILMD